jgi:hypothetical protein
MKKIGMLFNSADYHPAVYALSNLGFVCTLLPARIKRLHRG